MKSEPPSPSGGSHESWISHLKDYISSKGGIDRAAVRLHVHPNTLRKIINNMEVSYFTRRKVAKILRMRVPTTISQLGNSGRQEAADEVPKGADFSPMSKPSGLEPSPLILNSPISILNLSVRASNCLKSVGITTIAQLIENNVVRLRNIPSMGKKSIAEVIYRLKEYDLKLTDSEKIPTELPEFILKQELLFQKLKEAHRLYVERGSLEAAGKQLGMTRERVRQLLVKGTRLGLFEYKPFNYPFIPKAKILEDYKKLRNLNAVALENHITTTYLHKLFTAYNITEETLQSARIAGQKAKCIEQYNRIKDEMGHHPTTTELQRENKSRYLSMRITRLWGSFDSFRKELNIPVPPQGSRTFSEDTRKWREHRQRLALVMRMERLDNMREYLRVSGPMSLTEIANKTGIGIQNAYNLIRLLMATGEVIRDGSHVQRKYRLIS